MYLYMSPKQNKKEKTKLPEISFFLVSLCSPGCPRTHSIDQDGLELRNLPVSASQVL